LAPLARAPSAALGHRLRCLFGTPEVRGPVWAVTMVKNEERRIEGSIRRLVAGGVDVVVVADNLSTDHTADMLRDLARELPVLVVTDREPAYYQGQKMSLLARRAARHGASWIIPFDADELWFAVDGDLAETLHELDGDIAVARMYDFIPDGSPVTDPYRDIVRRAVDSPVRKVAFRAHALATISTGNHDVQQPGRLVRDRLYIRHYPYIDFEHFQRKAATGKAALDATDLAREFGAHWRQWASGGTKQLDAWEQILLTRTVVDPLPPHAFVSTR